MEYVYLNKEVIYSNIRNLSQVTFEVTDACNLQCKYCGYGELYDGYDTRKSKMLSLEQAYPLLEYLLPIGSNQILIAKKLTSVFMVVSLCSIWILFVGLSVGS